ncbi:MAG TPA: phage tail assembly protein [Deinococcales bacterium]|nr:phage tail assembly protein [Deinococcales bacterium]
MPYQTETDKLPRVTVKLQDGLLIDGKRVKEVQVRKCLMRDIREANEHPAAKSTVSANIVLYALVTTVNGLEADFSMIESLTKTDYDAIQEASNKADALPLSEK